MPYARDGLLLTGALAGAAYAAGSPWPVAVLCYLALAGYVLLGNASWRVRGPLSAGLGLVAVASLPIGGASGEFGWFAYSPADVDLMVRRMAEQSLVSIAWTGLAALAGCVCLCAAAWALPRRRSLMLAVLAGLVALGAVSAAILSLTVVRAHPAVGIAGLGVLACLAVAAVASQRAGMAWLAIVGAALLAWQSLDRLMSAATSAELARGPDDGLLFLGMTIMTVESGLDETILLAAVPAGLLLVVLALSPRPGRIEKAAAQE